MYKTGYYMQQQDQEQQTAPIPSSRLTPVYPDCLVRNAHPCNNINPYCLTLLTIKDAKANLIPM